MLKCQWVSLGKILLRNITSHDKTVTSLLCYHKRDGLRVMKNLIYEVSEILSSTVTLLKCFLSCKYGLLAKCEVKMAKYWPSSFSACLWTETKLRSINSRKRMRPISSHLDRANLVNKGFVIWLLGKCCLRNTAGSPEQARWCHSGSQSLHAIWFILPAGGACHIIITGTVYKLSNCHLHVHLLSCLTFSQ